MNSDFRFDTFGPNLGPELIDAFARVRRNDASGEDDLLGIFKRGVQLLIRLSVGESGETELVGEQVISSAMESIRKGRIERATDISPFLWLKIRRACLEKLSERRPTSTIPEGLSDFLQNLAPADRQALARYSAGASMESICSEAGIQLSRLREIKAEARRACLRMYDTAEPG